MKAKIRYVAVGECPRCHQQFIRPPECTAAVCDCLNPNPTVIPLSPALLLPASIYKRYAEIAELAEVSVEVLVNAVLEEAAKKKLKELKSLPNLVVTVKGSEVTEV
jgi:hypothetical protein